MKRLGDDRAPFALKRFDARGFAEKIEQRFGGTEERRLSSTSAILQVNERTGPFSVWVGRLGKRRLMSF
jgi:hypothetical protein